MKYSALLKVLVVSLIGTLSATAQNNNCPPVPPQAQVAASTIGGANGRDVQFNISGLSNCATAFYLFDDGHFSSLLNPQHEFHSTGNYESKYYALEAYEPTIPPEKSIDLVNNIPATMIPVGGFGKGSSTSNQLFKNGLPIDLGQSWRTAEDNHLIYIISFRHPANLSKPAYGTVKLELDPSMTFVRTIGENGTIHPHNNWADIVGTTGYDPATHQVNWTYQGLDLGNQNTRHLYVEVSVAPNTHKSNVATRATIDYTNLGLVDINDVFRDQVKLYPHDPNEITVREDCLQAYIDENQTLNYRVDFQNEGNGFATEVLVEVLFNGHVLPSTFMVTGSSHPISAAYVNTAGNLEFLFSEINLPGLNQSYPNTYKPNQTTGYVEFSICTEFLLPVQEKIDAFAQIFFDNQPPVVTDPDVVIVEDYCPFYQVCDNMAKSLLQIDPPSGFKAEDASVSPNPFGNRFNLEYTVPLEGSDVSIHLRSLSGQRMGQAIFEGFQPGGTHRLEYEASKLPAGIYFLDIRTGELRQTLRVVKTQ